MARRDKSSTCDPKTALYLSDCASIDQALGREGQVSTLRDAHDEDLARSSWLGLPNVDQVNCRLGDS